MFKLPDSFEESYEHFHLPEQLKNVGIMNDIHIPYHNIRAMEETINYFIKKKVDSVFLNGDIIEDYHQSNFNPDPLYRRFWDEIGAFKDFISVLKKHVTSNIYYKLGNHEERYERTMIQKCPEFLDIPVFEFKNVMGCNELGVEVITDQRIVYIGKLPVIHGHEAAMRYASVNPARTLFLKAYKSSLCGHLHRTSNHTEQGIDGKIISTWSVGCLCGLHPKYRRINNWNHGCARIEKDEEGNFEVINFRLMGNKMFMT